MTGTTLQNPGQKVGGMRDEYALLWAILQEIITLAANLLSPVEKHSETAAINSTDTATAAQVATGYITSTSAAPTTITLPTGTLLGAELNAAQGTTLDLYIDNTAGSSTVTIAVNTDAILSSGAVSSAGTFGLLTVSSGVTGIAKFTLMFSSATHYVFSRAS